MSTNTKLLLLLAGIALMGLTIWLSASGSEARPPAAPQTKTTPVAVTEPGAISTATATNSPRPTVVTLWPTPTPTSTPPPSPTPTGTATPTPTAGWGKIYEATGLEGWPGWCVKPDVGPKPVIRLAPVAVENFCFNEASGRIAANFAVEWLTRVDEGTALFLFGQNNAFYRIAVQPDEGILRVRRVENFAAGLGQELGEAWPAALQSEAGALNRIEAIRQGSTITLTLNGQQVKVITDTLFGDHTPLQVGFGAEATGEGGATVYLEELNLYAPANQR